MPHLIDAWVGSGVMAVTPYVRSKHWLRMISGRLWGPRFLSSLERRRVLARRMGINVGVSRG